MLLMLSGHRSVDVKEQPSIQLHAKGSVLASQVREHRLDKLCNEHTLIFVLMALSQFRCLDVCRRNRGLRARPMQPSAALPRQARRARTAIFGFSCCNFVSTSSRLPNRSTTPLRPYRPRGSHSQATKFIHHVLSERWHRQRYVPSTTQQTQSGVSFKMKSQKPQSN